MSAAWTEDLAEPLRSIARGGAWDRIEEAREGGWLLLSRAGTDRDTRWFHAERAGTPLVALDPLKDPRLERLSPLVGAWLAAGHAVRMIAWRVGSRAIFRLDTDLGPRIVKHYRRDRQVLERWRVLGPGSPSLRLPQLLEWDPDSRLLTLESCPGESLHRRWMAGRGAAADAEPVADVLEWLAAAELPVGFPRHRVDDEVRILTERLEVFHRTLAHPHPAAAPLVGAVVAALTGLPPARDVLCHRDFHDKQLLLDQGRTVLLDLDLAAAGHSAIDVGNILAHLRLRQARVGGLPFREIASRIVERAERTRELGDALPAWTAATLARLGLIYARRRRESGLIATLLTSAADALERRNEWLGIL